MGEPHPENDPTVVARPFFPVALAFFVAAGLGLAWSAPALAAGAFSDPRLIATTHLLTLGWITTSLLGAFYAFLPGMLEASLRWRRLALAGLLLWGVGVAAFVAGLALSAPGLHVPAAAGLGLALLLFGATLGRTLGAARRRGFPGWCAAGALLSLLGSWLLGVLLAVNLGADILDGSRFPVLAVHLHLGAGGWALLAAIGLSRGLLPVLLSSRPGTETPGAVAAILLAAGAGLLLLSGHLLPGAVIIRPAVALMAVGALAFLFQAFLYFLRRPGPAPVSVSRTGPVPGMRLVAASLVLLALAVAAGLASLAGDAFRPRLLTAYGVLLLPGGLSLLIAGHYYVGLRPLSRPRSAARPTGPAPRFHPWVTGTAALLLVGGIALLAGGILAGVEALCRTGGIAFAAGAALQAGQMRPGQMRPPGPARPR